MLNKVTSTMVDGGGAGKGEQVASFEKQSSLFLFANFSQLVQWWMSESHLWALTTCLIVHCRWTWMSWTSRWSRSRRCLWRSRRWWRRWAAPPPPTRPSWPVPRSSLPSSQFSSGFLLPPRRVPIERALPNCRLLNTDHYMFHSINRDNEQNFDQLLQMFWEYNWKSLQQDLFKVEIYI